MKTLTNILKFVYTKCVGCHFYSFFDKANLVVDKNPSSIQLYHKKFDNINNVSNCVKK